MVYQRTVAGALIGEIFMLDHRRKYSNNADSGLKKTPKTQD